MLSTRMRLSLLIVVFLGLPAGSVGLSLSHTVEQYGHSTWGLRDGSLPAHPRSIEQTADGYLWLATDVGLLRFDGVRFVPWEPAGNSQLPSSVVVALAAGRDGTLWIGTTLGLARLRDGRISTYAELQGQHVSALMETRDGTLWAGTNGGNRSGLLCRVRDDQSICHGHDGAIGRFVLALHEDRLGRLWVGTSNGLWRWGESPIHYRTPQPLQEIHSIVDDGDNGLLVAMNREIARFTFAHGFESYSVGGVSDLKPIALLRDRHGGLWVGTQDDGILHVRDGQPSSFGRGNGLSGNFVLSLCEDREGNVWVGTLSGLDRFREVTAARISTKQGLANETVLSVEAAADGTVWLVTLEGLSQWRNGRIGRNVVNGLVTSEGLGALLEDRESRLWFSSLRGLGYLTRGDRQVHWVAGVPTRYVHAIVEDHLDGVWISDQSRGLFRVRDNGSVDHVPWSTFEGNDARALVADPNGGVWLGFSRGGIAYFDGTRVIRRFDSSSGLGEGRVNGLHLDEQGALWVATQRGLSRVLENKIDTLKKVDGLPCESVQWVIGDRSRALWLHTACGVARISANDLKQWQPPSGGDLRITTYDTADGVMRYADLGGYGPKVAVAADGRLWFASYDGAVVINPNELPFNTIPPPVQIESATADRVTYPASSSLALPPMLRDLRIDYTALSLVAPEKVRFRYRLDGRDREWVDAGNRRQAFYTDLPPGTYQFRVMAANNHGVWNENNTVWSFSIEPTIYQTMAFRVLSLVLVVLALFALYRLRVRRLASTLNIRFEERLAERTRIAHDLHDTLLQGFVSASMQLHFVAADVGERPLRSRLDEVLKRIANVLEEGRHALTGLRAATPDDLEAAFARDAQLFRNEQSTKIQFVVKGDRRPLRPLVRDAVYYIGREALANAFKHAKAKHVEVELEFSREALKLFVRDDGCGVDSDTVVVGRAGHWGLQNMRERAEAAGGTLKLWSRVNAGTEMTFSVPGGVAFAKATSRWTHWMQPGSWLRNR